MTFMKNVKFVTNAKPSVKDTQGTQNMNFKVYCNGIKYIDSHGKTNVIAMQEPIHVHEAHGDIDGVLTCVNFSDNNICGPVDSIAIDSSELFEKKITVCDNHSLFSPPKKYYIMESDGSKICLSDVRPVISLYQERSTTYVNTEISDFVEVILQNDDIIYGRFMGIDSVTLPGNENRNSQVISIDTSDKNCGKIAYIHVDEIKRVKSIIEDSLILFRGSINIVEAVLGNGTSIYTSSTTGFAKTWKDVVEVGMPCISDIARIVL